MKHSILADKIEQLERKIFNCTRCKEFVDLRKSKEHNCPVLGFCFNNYAHAKVLSICEAPGVYKPQKGEVYIERYEDFHRYYDYRIQNEANIGKQLFDIFKRVHLTWRDIQHFNVVCCSPPNYRKPTVDEVECCIEYLEERIKLLQKVKIIVSFGTVARQAIMRLKLNIPIVKSYHPSYIYKYMPKEDREDYINDIVKQIKNGL